MTNNVTIEFEGVHLDELTMGEVPFPSDLDYIQHMLMSYGIHFKVRDQHYALFAEVGEKVNPENPYLFNRLLYIAPYDPKEDSPVEWFEHELGKLYGKTEAASK